MNYISKATSLILLLVTAGVVLTYLKAPKKGALSGNAREIIRKKWDEIESLITQQNPSANKAAVMEADKLLGYVLGEMGYTGTIADKLKATPKKFSNLNNVWSAHKFRNHLVHDIHAEALHFQAKDAIDKFRQAFRDLGVI